MHVYHSIANLFFPADLVLLDRTIKLVLLLDFFDTLDKAHTDKVPSKQSLGTWALAGVGLNTDPDSNLIFRTKLLTVNTDSWSEVIFDIPAMR